MRFSPTQDNNYGVGLEQETPPQNVDKSMMAATGDTEPGGGGAPGENSMVSNLPLLFANGYPTSLEKISPPALERFIAFMIQCSMGHNTTEGFSKPKWWPKELQFSIPLVKPKKYDNIYMELLKKTVLRCYMFHDGEYLLRFCSYLAQYPHDKLEYVNNWDSTTSLYLKTTGKLLVTFRNENMNYDKKTDNSPRKLLLSNSKTTHANGNKNLRRSSARFQVPSPAMVEPIVEDIYLCDNCDAELIGSKAMKEHETLCYRIERTERPITPECEPQPIIEQDQFLEYFKLKSSNPTVEDEKGDAILNKNDSKPIRSSGRVRATSNLTKCPWVAFSSPLGLSIAKKSKTNTIDNDERQQEQRLDRIERYLVAPPLSMGQPKWLSKNCQNTRWPKIYKPRRSNEYMRDHYNFGNFSGKSALDVRSQLLYLGCKRPYIYPLITCLSDEEVLQRKRDSFKYKSPERKALRLRPKSPSVEPLDESTCGDEPIIIDLVDDEPVTTLEALFKRPFERKFHGVVSPPIATVNPLPNPAQNFSPKNGDSKKNSKKLSNNSFIDSKSSDQSIIVVDLCSSDDELQEDTNSTIDENKDPMQKSTSTTDMCVDSRYFNSAPVSPNKAYSRPCIYASSTTGDWSTNYRNVSEARKNNFFHRMSLFKTNNP